MKIPLNFLETNKQHEGALRSGKGMAAAAKEPNAGHTEFGASFETLP